MFNFKEPHSAVLKFGTPGQKKLVQETKVRGNTIEELQENIEIMIKFWKEKGFELINK